MKPKDIYLLLLIFNVMYWTHHFDIFGNFYSSESTNNEDDQIDDENLKSSSKNIPQPQDPICKNQTSLVNVNNKKKIDPKIVEFKLNPDNLCSDSNPLLFVYIFNKANSFEKRKTIRKTWANRALFPNVKFAFILGIHKDESINIKITKEFEFHKDIIQSTVEDTLRNLSYKSVTAWKWIKDHCLNTKYILKIDDDTMPNMFLVLEFLNYLRENHSNLRNQYFCEILKRAHVDRSPTGKYSITCDEYDKQYYEPYCCGVANIITSDLISKLYNATFNAKYFWVDDAYVGFITNSLKVKMIDINEYIISFKETDRNKYEKFFFFRDIDSCYEINRIWEFLAKKHELINKMKKALDLDFFEKII